MEFKNRLLENKTLYFSRADLLGDTYEGAYPDINKANLYSLISTNEKLSQSDKKLKYAYFKKMRNNIRKFGFVSCWHINNVESAAMWKCYGENKNSICIQSTPFKLQIATRAVYDKIAAVEYVDFESHEFNDKDVFEHFYHKRKSFSHEQELRAVILNVKFLNPKSAPKRKGIHVKTNFDELIEKIYISPNSDDWLLDLMIKILAMYKLEKKVIRSNINSLIT